MSGSFPRRWLLVAFAIVVVAFPLITRRMFRSSSPARSATETVPAPEAAPPPPVVKPPPTLPPTPPPPADPQLRQWQAAIRQRNAQGVISAQSTFLAREGEYREPLMKMAKEDPEPRIRAFSVAVLGRMTTPPPEQFFLDRLGDEHEHPRRSSLEALEKIGTSACLPALERLASSDPAEAVKAAATRAAKAVRSR